MQKPVFKICVFCCKASIAPPSAAILSKSTTVLWKCCFVLKRVLCDSTFKRSSKCAISFLCEQSRIWLQTMRSKLYIEWANALVPPTPFQGRPLLRYSLPVPVPWVGRLQPRSPLRSWTVLAMAGRSRQLCFDGPMVGLSFSIGGSIYIRSLGVLRTVSRGQWKDCDSSKLWHLLFTNTRKRWKLLEIAWQFDLSDNSTYPGLLVVKVWQKQRITTPWTFNAQDKVGTGSSNDWNKVGLLGVVIINHHLLPGLLVQTLDVFLAFVHDFGTALGGLESKWWQAVPGYCLDDF